MMVNCCPIGVAGKYSALPFCEATMLHCPTAIRFAVLPEMVQMDGLAEV
jgi:hypothetical protein